MDLRDKNNLAPFYGCDINKLYSSNYYKIIEGLSKNCDTKDVIHAGETLAKYYNHSGTVAAIDKALKTNGNKSNYFIVLIMMANLIHVQAVNNQSSNFLKQINNDQIHYYEHLSKVIVIGKIDKKDKEEMLKKAKSLYEINLVNTLYKKSNNILNKDAFNYIEGFRKIGHGEFYSGAIYSIVQELLLKK